MNSSLDNLFEEMVSGQTPMTEESNEQIEVVDTSEVEDLKKQILYLTADLDNVRKQNAKRIQNLTKQANEKIMLDLVGILDDLSRAQNSIEANGENNAVKQGVNLIFDKLQSVLSTNGLSKIETNGVKFNTSFHEAIAQVPSENYESGDIVECVENGYMLYDKVIRYAKVAVAI